MTMQNVDDVTTELTYGLVANHGACGAPRSGVLTMSRFTLINHEASRALQV